MDPNPQSKWGGTGKNHQLRKNDALADFDSANLMWFEARVKTGLHTRDHSPDLNRAATLRLGLMLAEIDDRAVLGTEASQLGEASDAAAS